MAGPEGTGPSPEELGYEPPEQPVDNFVEPTPDTTTGVNPEPAEPVVDPEEARRQEAEQRRAEREAEKAEREAEKQAKRDEKAEAKRERQEEKSRKKRTEREQKEIEKAQARAHERRIKGYAEMIKHGARSPQELQDMMREMSFKDFKEAQERAKYGKGFGGKFKAFMAGEHDFEISDDGTIEDHNALKEAGRRLISTFGNRRTLVSAGTYLTMGALTGGLGWAAGGVLLGGIAGRGAAELGELVRGTTRESRESLLYAERARWERMQQLSMNIQELRAQGNEDPAVTSKMAIELVDLMYRQGENVLLRDITAHEQSLAAKEERFNKIRNRLQLAGELVGGAVGLTSVLNGGVEHLDMDFWNKLDGQSVFHGVQLTQHGSNFLYSSAAEAASASAQHAAVIAGGHFGAHTLGATASEVLAYTVAERTLPMLVASGLAWASERRAGTPEKYYQTLPDGKRVFYTRSESGTYQIWEIKEGEKAGNDKDKKEKTYSWVGRDVDEKDVPPKFKEYFADSKAEDRARKAERIKGQIQPMSEYIRNTADKHRNPVPETPRGFTYDWNEQPKFVDAKDLSSADRWYRFKEVTVENEVGQKIQKDIPASNLQTGKIIEVRVLGVDIENNRIAYVGDERIDSGAEHLPVEVTRLDDFLTKFHLHLDAKAGVPIVPKSAESGAGDDNIIDAEFTVDEPEKVGASDGAPEGRTDNKPETAEPTDTKKEEVTGPKKQNARPEDIKGIISDLEKEFLDAYNAKDNSSGSKKEGEKTEPAAEALPLAFEELRSQLLEKFSREQLARNGVIISEKKDTSISDIWEEDDKGNKKAWVQGETNPMWSITLYEKNRKGEPKNVRTMRLIYKENARPELNFGHYDTRGQWQDEQPSIPEFHQFMKDIAAKWIPAENASTEKKVIDYSQDVPVPINKPKAAESEVEKNTGLPEGFVELPGLLLQDLQEGDVLLLRQPAADQEKETRFYDSIANATGQRGEPEIQVTLRRIDKSGVVNFITKDRAPLPFTYDSAIQPLVLGRKLREDEKASEESPTQEQPVVELAENNENGEPAEQPVAEAAAPTEEPAAETEVAPEEVEEEHGWERFGIEDLDDLVGRKIKLTDPVAFFTTTSAPMEGELSTDEVTPNAEFTIENVAGDLLEIRLNGAKLTVESSELEPQVSDVI